MNAKKEFLEEISGKPNPLCAFITINNETYHLITGYTMDEFNSFLSQIDFEYNDGYGSQNLHGCIWYTNGCWSDRREYDGSEWWEYNKLPEIPVFLDRNIIRSGKIDKII